MNIIFNEIVAGLDSSFIISTDDINRPDEEDFVLTVKRNNNSAYINIYENHINILWYDNTIKEFRYYTDEDNLEWDIADPAFDISLVIKALEEIL